MKTFALAAATVLAISTAAVSAKEKTTTVQFNDSCDSFTVTVDHENAGIVSSNPNCDPGFGGGKIGKIKRIGNYAVFGFILNKNPGNQWVIGLQYPFVSGGGYTFAYTDDGVHVVGNITGTYSVVGAAAKGTPGGAPITSRFKR